MMLRRIAALLLAALLLVSAVAFAEVPDATQVETGVREIMKYGNLVLEISGNALLDMGYDYGDVITVNVAGGVYEMPICPDYSGVDNGALVCRVIEAANADESYVIIAINSGDFATTQGIAQRTNLDEDPGYRWDYAEGYADGMAVTLSMAEKGGYLDGLKLHQLVMSYERADYPDLTDEQYANFREVTTTGMGKNVLYRASSPVNPDYGRNREADAAVNAAGIRTVMNMADSEGVMKGYEDYANTYYSKLDVIALNLVVDFQGQEFRDGLAEGLRFFATHEGPYLCHCNVGKDRTGFACAVMECLMGASLDEVVEDYMVTYYNYYGVTADSDTYDLVANSNIKKSLAIAFGVDDLADYDLAGRAEMYLMEIGMTEDEISALKVKLGTDID